MEEHGDILPFEASVETGVWRYAKADRLTVLVDAEEYFGQIQQAMLNTREEILLLGWDFDTRIHLARGRRWFQRPFRKEYPSRLGSFLIWLTRKNEHLDIKLLIWGFSFLQFLTRGSMGADLIRMAIRKQIQFKHDNQLPLGCSHHQKIVVLDRSLAACGGIDLTRERWDTRSHHLVDERRLNPWGHYYQPWHDLTVMMDGDIADALFDLVSNRWETIGGTPFKENVAKNDQCWPEQLAVEFTDVEVGISRSRAAYKNLPAIDEVEELFLRHIAEAKRFVYIENQYFASRTIVEAIAKRLHEDDPPEFVVVHPVTAEGWLEQLAMDDTRTALVEILRAVDSKNRFHLYVAYTGKVPIYVHSKLMIVDDQILRIGSSNLNNRSMGLDSECDVFIDATRPANKGCEAQIRAQRYSLLAEHCGLSERMATTLFDSAGSMAEVIASHGTGDERGEGRSLRPFEVPDVGNMAQMLAESQILDPEEPEDMFAAYPKGGLYRPGSILYRMRERLKRGRHE